MKTIEQKSYFLPKEQINVVILNKSLVVFPDETVGLEVNCLTLHPLIPRTMSLVFRFRRYDSLCGDTVRAISIGGFYKIKGQSMVCPGEAPDETIYEPSFIPLQQDYLDKVLAAA